MNRIRSLFFSLKQRPGLCVLLILLTIISIFSIKPGFYLIGWDNYSSYFNLPTNIFRTFFATWREYRGFGVPSDAESTDIFRQIFYLIISIFFSEQLLDQIYYLFALWVGAIGMYFCADMLLRDFYFQNIGSSKTKKDIFSFITTAFYLFNLNTLSIFYSPVVPFTNRFYSLPLTGYLFLRFLNSEKKAKNLFLLAITIILTSGTYITPTVIITSLVAFFIFLAIRLNIKGAIICCVIYVLLNSFWLLPFFNYAIQKSPLIPLARTFIEINESRLNKPTSSFSLEKQLALYPSIFEITYTSLSGKPFPLHPLITQYTTSINHYVLFLFPILYILGIICIFVRFKNNKRVLWIPVWILLFLFLSSKESGPLGFIYIWLKQTVPLFAILYRIGDTKFHPYISFAGSFSAAYALLYLFSFLHQKSVKQLLVGIFLTLSILYIWLFRGYFNGNLIGSFAYSQIPNEYHEIAEIINNGQNNGKVLHLPMDMWHNYWRSFSWGYYGSAFFNFLINKPYFDKTFEPASMENAYFHSRLSSLINSFYRTNDSGKRKQLAYNFLHTLQQAEIRYVILDESISSSIYARNMIHDIQQYPIQAKEILQYLLNEDQIKPIYEKTIQLTPIYAEYKSLYPIDIIGPTTKAPSSAEIIVYEITTTQPVFQSITSTQNVDPGIKNLLETEIPVGDIIVTQNAAQSAQLIPFMQQNHTVEKTIDSITLNYQNPNNKSLPYAITTILPDDDSHMIDVYGKLENNKLNLTFYHRYFPTINGHIFSRYIGYQTIAFPDLNLQRTQEATILSNWPQTTTNAILDSYRLQLNDIFLPIPTTISTTDTPIGSYMLHEKTIRVALLAKVATEAVNTASFAASKPFSCFGTPPNTFAGNVLTSQNSLQLITQNGSSCAQAPIKLPEEFSDNLLYGEIEVQIHKQTTQKNEPSKLVNSLFKEVISKESEAPTTMYLCFREGILPNCLNTHRVFRVTQNNGIYLAPLGSFVSSSSNYSLDLGLVNLDTEKQSVTANNINYNIYSTGKENEIVFDLVFEPSSIDLSGPIRISFPKALSAYSYDHKPEIDAFFTPLDSCANDPGKDRLIRYLGNVLINDMYNCSMHFAQRFTYASNRPYLFSFDYWIGSGQQPLIVLGKDGDNYFSERTSLYQGYPNFPTMKQFQDAGLFSSYDRVKSQIDQIQLSSGSRLIDPLFFSDKAPAETAIHIFQTTENEGIMGLKSFDMIEYPLAWQQMKLTPPNSTYLHQTPVRSVSYQQILPSLWKIENTTPGSMLAFNQGYDSQWGLYSSFWSVILGSSSAKSIECNGFANCFVIPQNTDTAQSLYVFYWPERLSIAGWIATLATITVPLFWMVRKKSRNELPN